MEATLRSLLKDALSDYVQKGLEQVEMSTFPMVIRDIELNAKRLNHSIPESAVDLSHGKIGSVTITPGWMGNINVVATDIELNFNFSAAKAMKHGLRRAMDDGEDTALAAAIAASLQEEQQKPTEPATSSAPSSSCPYFCSAHNASEKRAKSDRQLKQCSHCGDMLRCSYRDLQFCPKCSNDLQRCMICGHAAEPKTIIPKGFHQKSTAGRSEDVGQRRREAFFQNQMATSHATGAAIKTRSADHLSSDNPGFFEGFFGNFSSDWWKLCDSGDGTAGNVTPKGSSLWQTRRYSFGGA